MIAINDEKHHLFLKTPRILLNVWVEVVVPTLTALLWLLAWDLGCNLLPALWTFLLDEVGEPGVFLNSPRTFDVSDKVRFKKMTPSVQTLVIASALDTLRYLAPVTGPVLQLSHNQLVVLLSCPVAFDDLWIKNNVPSLVALLLSPATYVLSYFPPILSTVDSY